MRSTISTPSGIYLAALAIESGATWITTDRGFFARLPGLRWDVPLPS